MLCSPFFPHAIDDTTTLIEYHLGLLEQTYFQKETLDHPLYTIIDSLTFLSPKSPLKPSLVYFIQ